MMEKMIALQQKRRSKKGGFTLVELIVVLVILAILAALLIPALTGYIDRAKEKSIIAETRQIVMAAQTCMTKHTLMSQQMVLQQPRAIPILQSWQKLRVIWELALVRKLRLLTIRYRIWNIRAMV